MPSHRLLRLALRPALRAAAAQAATIPSPRDEPAFHTGEADADRVLLVGNGQATGWGVATHQLALTGALGHALRAATGRPANVDFVGGTLMAAENATAWLGGQATKGYRAAVVVLGVADALHGISERAWARSLTALLTRLDTDLEPGAPVVVSTIPAVTFALPSLGGPLRRRLERHTDRLNAVVRSVARDFAGRVTLFEDAATDYPAVGRIDVATQYREIAERIARTVGPLLDAAPPQPAVWLRPPSEWTAKELAFTSDGAGDGPLQQLTDEATGPFGVPGASVTILDGEYTWVAASSMTVPAWLPRDLTFCETTVAHGETLVVSDVRHDPRFRGNALARALGLRFYAGHPVRDASGRMIGAVCIVDFRARTMTDADVDRLRTLATRAEMHLHDLERQLHFAR